MIGDLVMTQKDVQTDLKKPDVIGMGSYNSDSHNIQRVPTPDGGVENEGDMQVGVTPYQIPYRMMLPKRDQATNLLVPVCFSASHVAYSSLRMEPQYMIIGQAAGVAASLALKGKLAVQDVDPSALSGEPEEPGRGIRVGSTAVWPGVFPESLPAIRAAGTGQGSARRANSTSSAVAAS